MPDADKFVMAITGGSVGAEQRAAPIVHRLPQSAPAPAIVPTPTRQVC